jgi:hypothetical protein
MRKIIFISSLLCISTLIHGQNHGSCQIIKATYNSIVAKKYLKVHIANITSKIEVESDELFVSLFKSDIKEKSLQRALLIFKNEPKFSKLTCFSKQLLIDKDSILNFLNSNRLVKINADTPFVKFIDQKQNEISKIEDLEKRMKLLNDLTLTTEFKKYTALVEYNTPRLIQFSPPVFVDQYCFIRIKILKNNTDDWFSYVCLYKKEKNKWLLLKKVSY